MNEIADSVRPSDHSLILKQDFLGKFIRTHIIIFDFVFLSVKHIKK